MRRPLIHIQNLHFSYGPLTALEDISFALFPGDFYAVMGPNGGGKSTFLKLLVGLLTVPAGMITYSMPKSKIAYLPQQHTFDHHFPIRVVDVVAMGLFGKKVDSFLKNKLIADALTKVGLSAYENTLIHSLSGGQFQRMLFARLMMQDADVVLLDEPFSAVDRETTLILVSLLKEWQAAGKTILIVIHDLRLALDHFSKILMINKHIVADGETKSILEMQLTHVLGAVAPQQKDENS